MRHFVHGIHPLQPIIKAQHLKTHLLSLVQNFTTDLSLKYHTNVTLSQLFVWQSNCFKLYYNWILHIHLLYFSDYIIIEFYIFICFTLVIFKKRFDFYNSVKSLLISVCLLATPWWLEPKGQDKYVQDLGEAASPSEASYAVLLHRN